MSRKGARSSRVILCAAALLWLASATVEGDALASGPLVPAPPPAPTLPASPPVPVQPPDVVQEPGIPPQPGLAPGSCTHRAPPPNTWRLVTSSTSQFAATVDPSNPCLLYRGMDGQTLQRSDDDGADWQTVFHDSRTGTIGPAPSDPCPVGICIVTTEKFAMSRITVPQPGTVELSELQNGDALARSSDAGTRWTLPNRGLAGQSVLRVIPAPSHPRTSYAVTINASTAATNWIGNTASPFQGPVPQLYRTDDDGASWSAVTLPYDAQVAALEGTVQQNPQLFTGDGIQVDPRDPHRLFAVVVTQPVAQLVENQVTAGAAGFSCQGRLYSSGDGGASWTSISRLPGSNCWAPQLTVIHSQRHKLRLAVSGPGLDYADLPTDVALSDDGGRTWKASPMPLPASGSGVLVADPQDPDLLLWVPANRCSPTQCDQRFWVSNDGLDTISPIVPPPFGSGGSWWVPYGLFTPFGFYAQEESAVAADDMGSFYVNLHYTCQFGIAAQPSSATGVCARPTSNAQSAEASTFWEITPQAGAGFGLVPPPKASSIQIPTPLTQLLPCAVPVWTGGGTQPGGSVSAQGSATAQSGSLGFDGHDLLYTQLRETWQQYADSYDGLAPYQGVIHALDPSNGCASLPDIVVSFDANEIKAWEASNGLADSSAISIDDLSYDARRNRIWVTLGDAADPNTRNGSTTQGLFLVDVTDGASTPRRAVAHLALPGVGCGWALSFDEYRNSFWTCPQEASGSPSEISASDGTEIPNCMRAVVFTGTGIATWALAGRSSLYLQSEDDRTIQDYDPDTCAVKGTYLHRTFAEPFGEDEQMACDPLTYGPTGRGGPSTPTTVLWLRDAEGFSISPYVIPSGACPLPTQTTYASPTASVPIGGVAQLCATLQQLYPCGTLGLPDLPVSFNLAGPVSIAVPGAATTTGTRFSTTPGCLAWPAAVPPGRYTVSANFDPAAAGRTAQYLPSSGQGTLTVTALPTATTQGVIRDGLGVPPLPPPGTPLVAAPPQPVPYSEAALTEQTQAQAQGQAQAQAQSVAQTQPGMMVQQRTRQQVAAQTARRTSAQAQPLLATRRQHSPLAPAAELIAGALMLCLGLISRRPATARAEARARRSRRTARR